eukprot:6859373-Prymnesium_polylepis.2
MRERCAPTLSSTARPNATGWLTSPSPSALGAKLCDTETPVEMSHRPPCARVMAVCIAASVPATRAYPLARCA